MLGLSRFGVHWYPSQQSLFYRLAFSTLVRLRDISVSKKLYAIVGAMAFLILAELLTLWFVVSALSSVRALVGAEGLWSKAQKDAIYQLERYHRTRQEADYQQFLQFLRVPLGDSKARAELLKPNPDLAIVREGLLEGRTHPDDIERVIWFLQNFAGFEDVANAMNYWAQGDSVLTNLMFIAEEMHQAILGPDPSAENLNLIIRQLDPINSRLTALEDGFSYSLGHGSRMLERRLLQLLLLVALVVEISGLLLTFSVSRRISSGLKEIKRNMEEIRRGNLKARIPVTAKDEIGQLAGTLNEMTDQLTRTNRELEQFDYVTSHDLQEPARTIAEYTELLAQHVSSHPNMLVEHYIRSLQGASAQVQRILKDLADYSQIGRFSVRLSTDCNLLVYEVQRLLRHEIETTGTRIKMDTLPTIMASPELFMVFRHLLANAITYARPGHPPEIEIKSERGPQEWIFHISDNGIGIEKQYHGQIFVIFQRLAGKQTGGGIGLASAKKIVEMHGGRIWVESEPGKGSTFSFTIADPPPA